MDTLEDRFKEPDGWKWGTFENADGASIRYGHIRAETPRATAVVCGGLTEFTEKYFEVVRGLTSRGFNIWAMDWRGQGMSDRYPEPNHHDVGHKRDFADDIVDLYQFVTDKVKHKKSEPFVYFGHSMGGHIGLRFLHDHPGVFSHGVFVFSWQTLGIKATYDDADQRFILNQL